MDRFQGTGKIISVILIASITLAYLVDSRIDITGVSLQTLASIISVVSSLILLAIAITLHNRFTSNQSLLDKQTDKVIELLRFMNAIRFSFEVGKDGKAIGYYYMRLVEYEKRKSDLISDKGIDYITYKNYADRSILDMMRKLEILADDPYIPKKIAKMIHDDLYIGTGKYLKKKEKVKNYLLLQSSGDFERIESTRIGEDTGEYDDDIFVELNKESFNTDDMMRKLELVYRSAYTWIFQNNKSLASTLNLEKIE